MRTRLRLRLMKQQRVGVFCFIILIVISEIFIHFENYFFVKPAKVPISKELMALKQVIEADTPIHLHSKFNYPSYKLNLKPFNPNTYTVNQWKELGFSVKQAQSILKYKEKVGSKFQSKAQLKKCFVISEEKYKELQAYILLPATSKQDNTNNNYKDYNSHTNYKKIKYFLFNPNAFTVKQWQSFGFSKKQAQGIINYRKYLGGNFATIEQIKDCYMIDNKKFNELSPYIRIEEIVENTITKKFPQDTIAHKENSSKTNNNINLKPFNPNDLDEQGWMNLGFTQKQVRVILNYKKSLRGRFTSLDQIQKCYVISKKKFEELKPYIIFE